MSENTNEYVRCNGRKVIYDSHSFVDDTNLIDVLSRAIATFMRNKKEAIYLDNYRKGIQPILLREKTIRPEINNRVVVNRASEINAFKVGYLLTEPVQYVSRATNEDVSKKISVLNDFMYEDDKEYHDRELADQFSVTGTAYRMVLPKNKDEDCPFAIYDLKTSETFIVYYSGLGHEPLLGVIEVVNRDESDNEIIKYCCYTNTMYYEVVSNIITKQVPHYLKRIPIIEYPNNSSRIGDFELVIPLLDAINLVYSNRIDGVEQFIQSLMKFINVDITEEDFDKLLQLGAIKLKTTGDGTTQDVDFITREMNQSQVQVLVDSLYQDILTICGMPNRNGGSSTSDTGSAVIMRDGWEAAESRARSTELLFKKGEKTLLKIVLLILKIFHKSDLELKNIGIKFTRRNYENISQKATVLTTMLGNNKIEPKLAFEHCGMFTDPEVAYLMSQKYAEKMQEITNKLTDQNVQNTDDNKKKELDDDNKTKPGNN